MSFRFVEHSYQFYEQVIIAVPIVAPLVVIPAVLAVHFVCGCLQNSRPKVLSRLADMISSGEEKKHYLQGGGEKASKWIFSLLAIKAIVLLSFGLAVFINESLVNSEIGCQSGNWDCFALSNRQAIRITNCSDLGQFYDNSIYCYHLAFEFSTGISEVGGIAFISQLVINAYIAAYFSVRFVARRCTRVICGNFLIFIFFILAFVAPITFAAGHVTLTYTQTLNFTMHNIIFGIYYPLIYVVVTLAMVIRSKCTFDDYDTDFDPNTTVITVGGTPGGDGTTEVGGAATPPPRASVQIAQGNKVHTINVI